MLRCQGNKHDRLLNVGPQPHLHAATPDVDSAVLQAQTLLKVSTAEGVAVKVEAPAARLQQRVVLVEPTALLHVEQQVVTDGSIGSNDPFHPHVHADVVATAGHRRTAVATDAGPYHIFRYEEVISL